MQSIASLTRSFFPKELHISSEKGSKRAICSPANSSISPAKEPKYLPPKSTVFPAQESFISAKEPYISWKRALYLPPKSPISPAKEPYISIKEHYISTKELSISFT